MPNVAPPPNVLRAGASGATPSRRPKRFVVRSLCAAALSLLALPIALTSTAGAQNPPATVALVDGNGIHITSEQQLDSRLIATQISTPQVAGTLNVWILLPTDFNPAVHYPVLYLLHGTGGTASDWVKAGSAEQITAGLPLIVVMPDVSLNDSGGSWCTNWVSQPNGAANWQNFHINQLIPWIDHNLPTIPNRDGRAIAGLSMGGYCAMAYASEYPDLFETALSFSGAPDIEYDLVAQVGAGFIIGGTEIALNSTAPFTIFGNPLTDQINWAAHDPATLAENLNDTNLFLFTGNGFPGPLDPNPVTDPSAFPGLLTGALIEGGAGIDTTLFHNRLVSLGIPSYYDAYGPGTHSWPYWTRDLAQSIGPIMADFANPLPAPSTVSYTSAASSYSVYGWQVTMNRTAEEFSNLEGASASGFSFAGSGSAAVVTPDDYMPGGTYDVTITTQSGAPQVLVETADGAGALHLDVPLGPANPFQEVPIGSIDFGTTVYTTSVAIAPAP